MKLSWTAVKNYIIQDKHYNYAQNIKSPLGRIYDKNGWILLLGVNHGKNTSLHLAEYLSNYKTKKVIMNGMPVNIRGRRIWNVFEDIEIDSDDFELIGNDYEKSNKVIIGKVGNAVCKLINQRSIVNYAIKWMEENRI